MKLQYLEDSFDIKFDYVQFMIEFYLVNGKVLVASIILLQVVARNRYHPVLQRQ